MANYYEEMAALQQYLRKNKQEDFVKLIDKTYKRLAEQDNRDSYETMLNTLEKRGKKIFADETMSVDVRQAAYAENQFACELVRNRVNFGNAQERKQKNAIIAVNNGSVKVKPKKAVSASVNAPNEPVEAPHKEYNRKCRHYSETCDRAGNLMYRGCDINMDMEYCGQNCPYATTVRAGRTKVY